MPSLFQFFSYLSRPKLGPYLDSYKEMYRKSCIENMSSTVTATASIDSKKEAQQNNIITTPNNSQTSQTGCIYGSGGRLNNLMAIGCLCSYCTKGKSRFINIAGDFKFFPKKMPGRGSK